MAPGMLGPKESFTSRHCLSARSKPLPDEVTWNGGKTPAGPDQALLLAGDAHQCPFQSSKFSMRHLSKHLHVSRLFAHPRVSRCRSLASAGAPSLEAPPFTHHRSGTRIFTQTHRLWSGFEASLVSWVLTVLVLDASAAPICSEK